MESHEFLKVLHDSFEKIRMVQFMLETKSGVFASAGLEKASKIMGVAATGITKELEVINDAESQWVSDSVKASWKASDENLKALSATGGALCDLQKQFDEGRSAKAWMLEQARSIDSTLPEDASVDHCARVIAAAVHVLNEKDCSCSGDHNGMMTNPECLVHGNRKGVR